MVKRLLSLTGPLRRRKSSRTRILSGATVTAGLLSACMVAAGTESVRVLSPADVFSLEVASDVQISPDGTTVAYVRVQNDIRTDKSRRSVWLVDATTQEQQPVGSDFDSSSLPRWSVDGSRLAYVTTSENGQCQLRIYWSKERASASITALPEVPGDISWSRDGRYLALTMLTSEAEETLNQPVKAPTGSTWARPLNLITRIHYREDGQGYLGTSFSHIFVVSAAGGPVRQLTFGPFDDSGPLSWSANSRTIVFSSVRGENPERNPLNSDIYSVTVSDRTMTQLTRRNGPDEEPAVSPDGSKIAYTGFDDEVRSYQNYHLYVMDSDGQHPRIIASKIDRSIRKPVWAADSKSIYVQYSDRGSTTVARVTLAELVKPVASGLAGSLLDRPYTGGQFSVARDGQVALTAGGPDEPADVVIAREGKAPRRLTNLNAEMFADKTLANVRQISVRSSFDQRPIDAWIVTPPDFDSSKKYPLILEIHGGPFSTYGAYFSTDDQLYAAAGFVVLYANPRGSGSYGEEFADLIDHSWPGHDYEDLMSAVDAALAAGFVDPDQLFVTGGSGGGMLTAWIIGQTHRFRAAALQKPLINWTSFALTSDDFLTPARYWFRTTPWEDPQAYWARSPLSLAGRVATPTMIAVGDEDYRTPIEEAEQYYAALRLRGVPTALVTIPGAGHASLAARPSQSVARVAAILAWFSRYRNVGK